MMLESFGYLKAPKSFINRCFKNLASGSRIAIKSYRVEDHSRPYLENGCDFFGYKLYDSLQIEAWATEAGFKVVSNKDIGHLKSLLFDSESLYTDAGIPPEKWARFTQQPIPFLLILEKP